MEDQKGVNRTYLIPANSKRSALIFGFFRPVDLLIFSIGTFITFVLLISLPVTELWGAIITIFPIVSTGFLVFPVPNYHNILVLLTETINFYSNRREYIWRGWCYEYEQSDE